MMQPRFQASAVANEVEGKFETLPVICNGPVIIQIKDLGSSSQMLPLRVRVYLRCTL